MTELTQQPYKVFNKQHKNVMRAINNLKCSEGFIKLNFELCYENNDLQNGKPQPFYKMTKDGFTFLIMGFTGKEASIFKEAFIEAFNEMDRQVNSLQNKVNELTALYQSVTNKTSTAGHDLCVLGKQVKPLVKSELDALIESLQLKLI